MYTLFPSNPSNAAAAVRPGARQPGAEGVLVRAAGCTEVEIDPAAETLSGLSKVCYVSCKDILTRDQALVLGMVGVLSDATMRQVEACLKRVLEML
jgi:hypothetical protein